MEREDERKRMERLHTVLQAWKVPEPPAGLYERLKDVLQAREAWWRKMLRPAFIGKTALRFAEAAAIVLITLVVSGRIYKAPVGPPSDNLATIHFYMTEHREAILQAASPGPVAEPLERVALNREDILYYEYIDEYRRISRPAVILRGPDSDEAPAKTVAPGSAIAGARALTLPEARTAVSFAPVAPARIHPGYILDTITKVTGRESLHLLYTNGIDTLSVFEQPLGGDHGLAAEDLREYAVYKSEASAGSPGDRAGMTILAWKNTHVSFVLIGRVDIARLMEIAQVFSQAGLGRNESGE